MANRKLTALPELTSIEDNDWDYTVDISDTSESAQGTSKKVRKSTSWDYIREKADVRYSQGDQTTFVISSNGYLATGLHRKFFADWEWQIRGIYYTNTTDFEFDIILSAEGLSKFWLVVLTDIGFQLVLGAESTIPQTPNIPIDNIVVSTILITDSAVTETTPTPELVSNKQNSLAVDGTGTKYPTVDAVNAVLPVTYAIVVYVNDTSPITATIFDDENPPTVNDNALKIDTDNLYIGTDASTWVYNGSTYVTKAVPNTSNFYIEGTTVDAGSDKNSNIYRVGGGSYGGHLYSSQEIVSKKGSSDTVLAGSNLRLSNNVGSEMNIFQLNASNGVDLWNYAIGTWNKRFTFSNDGYLTASNGQLLGGTLTTNHLSKSIGGGALSDSSFFSNGMLNGVNVQGGSAYPFQVRTATDVNLGFNIQSGEFSFEAVNDAVTLNIPIRFYASKFQFLNGNLLINSTTDNAVDKLQVNGSISATNYTGSATLTSTPTAPTATAGTNTNQIATTAFVAGEVSTSAYWTKTGNDIRNNNSGAVELKPATKVSVLNSSNVETISLASNGDNRSLNFIAAPASASGAAGMYGLNSGQFLRFDSWNGNTGASCFSFSPTYMSTHTSGTTNVIDQTYTSAPTSGTWGFNMIKLTPTINQTGGANGITRGIYINPTLTSAADFRAIEVTAGDSRLQKLIVNNVIRLKSYTVATLPTGVQGDTAYVTDALAPSYLVTIVGGGSIVTPVFYNGTNWVAH
jgi:hypothetical protein